MATKKASAQIIDMTNVKDGGQSFNTKRMPEGDYLARVLKVEDAESKKDGGFQWLFTIGLEKHPLPKYPYYCKLQENQLWKIRNLLVAAGLNVPKKKLKLDPEKVVGKLIAITLEDGEYDGKMKSVISTIFPPSELEGVTDDDDEDLEDEDAEDEDEPVATTRAKKRTEAEPSEDDEDEDDDDEDEEEPPPPPKKKAKKKTAPEPEPEDDDDDEDEDEEEEPEPPKKKAKKRKVSDEELEELDIEDV